MAIGDGAIRWARGHIHSEGKLLFALMFALPPYLVLRNVVATYLPGLPPIMIVYTLLIGGGLLMRGRGEQERILLIWLTNYVALLVGLAIALAEPLLGAGGGGVDSAAWVAVAMAFLSVLILQIQHKLGSNAEPAEQSA